MKNSVIQISWLKPTDLGPVVQSIVSLTCSLMVRMLTALVSTISNSQVFLLKKNVGSFCKCKNYSHFFSKNSSIYAIFNDQRFNHMLTNDIVSFEQPGPGSTQFAKAGYIWFSRTRINNVDSNLDKNKDHAKYSFHISVKEKVRSEVGWHYISKSIKVCID